MPGRAVCTSTRSLSRVRSISMRLIAADSSRSMIRSRIFQSSVCLLYTSDAADDADEVSDVEEPAEAEAESEADAADEEKN